MIQNSCSSQDRVLEMGDLGEWGEYEFRKKEERGEQTQISAEGSPTSPGDTEKCVVYGNYPKTEKEQSNEIVLIVPKEPMRLGTFLFVSIRQRSKNVIIWEILGRVIRKILAE